MTQFIFPSNEVKKAPRRLQKKWHKIVALFLTLNLLAEVVAPTAAYALTGGPSQPEVNSFEPIGTTEMVDPFSGDFNYNIPLLTVPGPYGGYPVNLSYHAGPGMEQEASWVGLGWNISPGYIDRSVRGVADDSKGDVIKREINMRPNRTFALGFTQTPSFAMINKLFGIKLDLGFKLSKSHQIYFNNYRGVGIRHGFSLSEISNKTKSLNDHSIEGLSGSLGINFDSQSGLGISPSISYGKKTKESVWKFTGNAQFHSRQGIQSIGFKTNRTDLNYESLNKPGIGAGVRFTGSTYVPNVTYEMKGGSAAFSLTPGNGVLLGVFNKQFKSISGSYNEESVAQSEYNSPSYGYMYLQDRTGDNSMTDFNREKEVAITKYTPSLPMPVLTYDVFSIRGQGISGVFRPFRSEIGTVHDMSKESEFNGGSLDLDFSAGAGTNIDFRVEAGYSYSYSYSGDWKKFKDQVDHLTYEGKNTGDPLYEPFYFKSAGEMTADVIDNDVLFDLTNEGIGNGPENFQIHSKWDIISLKHDAENKYQGKDYGVVLRKRAARKKRIQSIEHRTNDEVMAEPGFSLKPTHLYPLNTFPGITSGATQSNFTIESPTSSAWGSHIREIGVLNPDGNRYVYGLPAYNTMQIESAFSIADDRVAEMDMPKTTTYTAIENSAANQSGQEAFYSSTTTPQFVHSYLLTQVISADYVDLTGDGPSEDDLGYYTKFNYSELSEQVNGQTNNHYGWRVPFFRANYAKGHYSNLKDDKASYTYGEKKIYYLNSIETKTHIAVFELNDPATEPRKDGYGAKSTQSNPGDRGMQQRFLKKIILYKKNDPNKTPIKTVHFEYSYDLCRNVENSDDYVTTSDYGGTLNIKTDDVNTGSGKLTLKKVWIDYLNNTKGSLSPYVFDYHEKQSNGHFNLAENPNYNLLQMDRWGNYRSDYDLKKPNGNNYTVYNIENPYVNQLEDADGDGNINSADMTFRNNQASAWSLKKITLPSGGEILIDYESDDYAFVQDKPATEMLQVVGTSRESETEPSSQDEGRLGKESERVYFKLDKPTTNANDVYKYIATIDYMYFKIWMKLKYRLDGDFKAYDYVEGYCKIEKGNGKYGTTADGKYGFVTVQKVDYSDKGSARKAHPFRKAGWQYLRFERPDLFIPPSIWGTAATSAMSIYAPLAVVPEALRMLTGYYTFAQLSGFCSEMSFAKPSFIRLATPDGVKYGAGHRVKTIRIKDNWSQMDPLQTDFDYGQEYSYLMPDGTSSGVAEYEPIIGGEENVMRQPVFYDNSDKLFNFRHNDAYIETPYGEAYYPSANVGYSRVTVRNLTRKDPSNTNVIVKKTGTGVSVTEFYTAKDFPVKVEVGDMQRKRYNVPIYIPFVGFESFNNRAYSQGYCIELNDMHGKLKSEATYPYTDQPITANDKPTAKVEYTYHTSAPNQLNNFVDVLSGNAVQQLAEMGVTREYFVDRNESSNWSLQASLGANIDMVGPSFAANVTWQLDYAESEAKTIVTNKIINRNGILSKVSSYVDGAWTTVTNKLFDMETGQPIYSVSENSFEQPVYAYSFPAHWSYDGMKGAYQNIGALFVASVESGTQYLDHAGAIRYFYPGDEVLLSANSNFSAPVKYWVNGFATSSCDKVILLDENGNKPPVASTIYAKIVRSGHRNMQSVQAGTVVSLSEVVNDLSSYALFYQFNNLITNTDGPIYTFEGCVPKCTETSSVAAATAASCTVTAVANSWCGNNTEIVFTRSRGCSAKAVFYQDLYDETATHPHFLFTAIRRSGNKVAAIMPGSAPIVWGDWVDLNGCFPQCGQNILQAVAQEFSPEWTYDYADAGSPMGKPLSASNSSSLASLVGLNPYRWGGKGIWRSHRGSAYQADREQHRNAITGTEIAKDGIFEHFNYFYWLNDRCGNFSNNLLTTPPNVQTTYNPRWTWASEISKYSPYNFALEDRNALNIYSGALYGYNNCLATAMTQNASYFESAFDGFEESLTGTYPAVGRGHLTFTSPPSTATAGGHTGQYSLSVSTALVQTTPVVNSASGTLPASTTQLTFVSGKDYVVSAWFKTSDGQATPVIKVNGISYPADKQVIEGWQRVEARFAATGSSMSISFEFTNKSSVGGHSYVMDDVREHPFKGAMVSYVYDPIKLWLLAELDNRNFATYYNYDEEGNVVQVKKETERGVMTLKNSRNNIKH